MGKTLPLALVSASVLALATDAWAVNLYDSGGYDTPARFSTSFVNPNENVVVGNVRGQDSGVNPWFFSGVSNTNVTPTATARVINASGGAILGGPVFSGTQSLPLDR